MGNVRAFGEDETTTTLGGNETWQTMLRAENDVPPLHTEDVHSRQGTELTLSQPRDPHRQGRQSLVVGRWPWQRTAIVLRRSPEALPPKQQTVGAPKIAPLATTTMLKPTATDDRPQYNNVQEMHETSRTHPNISCRSSVSIPIEGTASMSRRWGFWSVQRLKDWEVGATAASGAWEYRCRKDCEVGATVASGAWEYRCRVQCVEPRSVWSVNVAWMNSGMKV